VIVVDTNLVAYAVLPGARTSAALALAGREPVWGVPLVSVDRRLVRAFPDRVVRLEDAARG
jgi:hypothetical protein